jgi:hypothetical protein
MRNRAFSSPTARWLRAGLLIAVICAPMHSACGHEPESSSGEALAPYPHGRWRIASPEERARVTFWYSHILVTHADSNPENARHFRHRGWSPDTFSKRSRVEAANLAAAIAERARRSPEDFGNLAKELSEDVITRSSSGSLGGAPSTRIPALMLDALTTLELGQTSRPIETSLGFHVLRRDPAPPDDQLAGKHIVVRYTGTLGVESSARSRQDAKTLADRVASLAKHDDFAVLVEQYSEHADKVRGGDLGVWPRQRPDDNGRLLEALASLPIGGISGPIETGWGYEILMRTDPAGRQRLAMESLSLYYDSDAEPESPVSHQSQLAAMQSVQVDMALRPQAFDEARAKHCCKDAESFLQGRGPLIAEDVLARTPMGSMFEEPIDSGDAIILARRVEPSTVPAPASVLLAFPPRMGPDFEMIIRASPGGGLAQESRKVNAGVRKQLALKPEQDTQLAAIVEKLAVDYAATEPDQGDLRVELTVRAQKELEHALGAESYGRYRALVDAWSSQAIIDSPRR